MANNKLVGEIGDIWSYIMVLVEKALELINSSIKKIYYTENGKIIKKLKTN